MKFFPSRLPVISFLASLAGVFALWICCPCAHATAVKPLGNKTPGIFLSTPEGKVLLEQNAHKNYIPASILKILTGFAAISHFGKDYHFPTMAYFHSPTATLYIKGFGDPLFVSEVIEKFSEQIYQHMDMAEKATRNPLILDHIVLDQSFFSPDLHIPGTGESANPYDAAVGALCANFNTVSFCRDAVTGKLVSAEPQTPLFQECIRGISVSDLNQGRVLLPSGLQKIYPGMLVQYFLEQKGIQTKDQVKGKIITGTFPRHPESPLVFYSDISLEEIVQKLLRYSNNFIANQLVLAMGADQYGSPATVEKGVKVLQSFARESMGMVLPFIAEGSGLSRQNKITPAQMGRLLGSFDPLHFLLRENEDTWYKTGTLTGVRSLAGYIKGQKARRFPFVIMADQPRADTVPDLLKKLIARVKKYEENIH